MAWSIFGSRRREAARESKASAVGAFTAVHGLGRPAWTPRETVAMARAGYGGNAVGFRCVRMIAEAAAAVGLRATEGGAALTDHPALDLIGRPNPGQDGAAFFEAAYGWLQLAGDAFIEAVPAADGAPAELHVLRPDRMRVIPGRDGWPEAFEYRVGARTHRFSMDGAQPPILHLRAFHPLDDHYGMSPMSRRDAPG
jgi:Phage-related protein